MHSKVNRGLCSYLPLLPNVSINNFPLWTPHFLWMVSFAASGAGTFIHSIHFPLPSIPESLLLFSPGLNDPPELWSPVVNDLSLFDPFTVQHGHFHSGVVKLCTQTCTTWLISKQSTLNLCLHQQYLIWPFKHQSHSHFPLMTNGIIIHPGKHLFSKHFLSP